MGFTQCINMPSIYFHKERKIKVPVHVDDPFAVCKTKADELWFHQEINKHLVTKGMLALQPARDSNGLPQHAGVYDPDR